LCPRPQCVRMGDKRSRQCAPFTLALSFRVSGLIRTSCASCPAGLWDAMRSVSWVSLDTQQLWSLHCASHEARCRWRELFMFSHGAQCRWEVHMSPRVVASQRCGAPIPSNVCLAYKLLFLVSQQYGAVFSVRSLVNQQFRLVRYRHHGCSMRCTHHVGCTADLYFGRAWVELPRLFPSLHPQFALFRNSLTLAQGRR